MTTGAARLWVDETLVAQRALRARDLVVFSNDWDGDPLSKTHIMRILARDNRVLWVNSIGNRAPRMNTHDFTRIRRKFGAFRKGLQEVERNLFVLSPLAIPFFGSKTIIALNGVLLRSQVKHAMDKLSFRKPISWSFLPASAAVSGTLGEELVVYHCVDEFSAFQDTNGAHIAALERRLLGRADLVITSSERLRANKEEQNANTVLVRHGVDWTHFSRALDSTTPIPEDIAKLPKPVIGFFGLVAQWVDLEAIEACARAYPQGSIALIGKVAPDVDLTALQRLPNVHLLGRKPYAQLPGYCRAFDVALMPFRTNELTLSSNPLKVREYLAAGLPVVSTDLPEVRAAGHCRIAKNASDFPVQVQRCLDQGAGVSKTRSQAIANESWEARVDEIRQHVGNRLIRLGKRV